MSSCKECVHYEVCEPHTEPNEDYAEVGGCPLFKPKSRFVELPCEVGQRVWFVNSVTDEICEATVINIELNYFTSPQEWIVLEYFSAIWGRNEYKSRWDLMYNKTVFLSREEAEKALAERSK
jgi:hypothetical protein